MVKLNRSAKSHAFQNGGGINLLQKNRVTDLLSVMITTGSDVPQIMCRISLNAKYIARISSA